MGDNEISIVQDFECHMNDLAVAFWATASKRFGEDSILGMRVGLFRRRCEVNFVTVKVGIDEYTKGVLGSFEIRGVRGYFVVGGREGEPLVKATTNKEFEGEVNDFFTELGNYLKSHSIYKGKALTSQLEFMDLSGASLNELTYDEEVLNDLREHVWALVEKREFCKFMNIKSQRKILFAGNFGTGKTMAAFITAKIAVEHGFTFMYMEPSVKSSYSASINSVLRFARRSQPAVVLFEDWDREQREGDQFAVGHIMSAIDGVLSKNSEVIIILTTNNPGKITAGMLRPGRIDKVINFNKFEKVDIICLLKKAIPEMMRHPDIDWDEVAKYCSEYSPAFVDEVGISSKLKAIRLAGDEGLPMVTHEILISAAKSLEIRSKKCQEALGFGPNS